MTAATPNSEILLEGDILFQNVTQSWKKLEAQLKKISGPCTLDFAKVGRIDSSVLTLWLCAERTAQAKGYSLTLANIPDELMSIADLVGVDEIIQSRSSH